jgi:hypothetical protein
VQNGAAIACSRLTTVIPSNGRGCLEVDFCVAADASLLDGVDDMDRFEGRLCCQEDAAVAIPGLA